MQYYITTILAGLVISQITKPEYWYDIFHRYHDIDEQYTSHIDYLLTDSDSYISSKKFVNGISIPNFGTHYYYIGKGWFDYIGMIKKNVGDTSKSYYKIFIPFMNQNAYDCFIKLLLENSKNSVKIMHIDNTDIPTLVPLIEKIHSTERPFQKKIIDEIIYDWENNDSRKYYISGERGIGKTSIGKFLHKKMKNSMLIQNFNPREYGIDISSLVLRQATFKNPVIIIINEFDSIISKLSDHSSDPRFCHAKDITSFNNMMDSIDQNPNVILITTGELSLLEMKTKNYNLSPMRKGRIDKYIECDG